MAAKDKQKENLERVTDFVEDRQLDADRMAQVRLECAHGGGDMYVYLCVSSQCVL